MWHVIAPETRARITAYIQAGKLYRQNHNICGFGFYQAQLRSATDKKKHCVFVECLYCNDKSLNFWKRDNSYGTAVFKYNVVLTCSKYGTKRKWPKDLDLISFTIQISESTKIFSFPLICSFTLFFLFLKCESPPPQGRFYGKQKGRPKIRRIIKTKY